MAVQILQVGVRNDSLSPRDDCEPQEKATNAHLDGDIRQDIN